MLQNAAAGGAEHTGPMGVVHIDKSVPSVGQSQQIWDRRNVAILAEHAVGHDDLACRGRLAEQFLEMIEIEMTIAITSGRRTNPCLREC
jgi:hypothetical protein